MSVVNFSITRFQVRGLHCPSREQQLCLFTEMFLEDSGAAWGTFHEQISGEGPVLPEQREQAAICIQMYFKRAV
jgi:hypothetical protein